METRWSESPVKDEFFDDAFTLDASEVQLEDENYTLNLDFENNSPEFGYGFVATFANRTALQRYANDPQHMTLGGRLVEMCVNGHHGIIVFDLSV